MSKALVTPSNYLVSRLEANEEVAVAKNREQLLEM
jgi:hypothetical protein